jgi:flagellar assembly protein FliH
MDPVIRSAQLAPFRTRLSEASAAGTRPGAPGTSAPALRTDPRTVQETMRVEIEKHLRAELATQAQKLFETERERARLAGNAMAVAEAKAAASKELERTTEQLQSKLDRVLSAMEQAHSAVLAKVESSVGEVAFAAVCRLVGHKAASQTFVMGLIEHTCAELRADAIATARLHPRDVHTLRDLLQDHELRVGGLGLKVLADESVALGGCVIEAGSGHYDGGLESQLRRLHAVLVEKATTG